MDGNGRWARERGLPRNEGHVEGLKRAREITLACLERGIPFLTLYVFSTENWRRSEKEVSFLFGLMRQHLRRELDFYRDNKIKVIHSGNFQALPQDIQNDLLLVEERTQTNQGITVNLLINYGGRDEIVRAAQRFLDLGGACPFEECLDHPRLPDLDLIIRTAGEKRLSNFMLWRSAYAELYFTEVRWPDFDTAQLDLALKDFATRQRNFGAVTE